MLCVREVENGHFGVVTTAKETTIVFLSTSSSALNFVGSTAYSVFTDLLIFPWSLQISSPS
jgi:hypothetical protein